LSIFDFRLASDDRRPWLACPIICPLSVLPLKSSIDDRKSTIANRR